MTKLSLLKQILTASALGATISSAYACDAEIDGRLNHNGGSQYQLLVNNPQAVQYNNCTHQQTQIILNRITNHQLQFQAGQLGIQIINVDQLTQIPANYKVDLLAGNQLSYYYYDNAWWSLES
ncbi:MULTISPECIES: hypothetical protein [Cysteiniphilum]|uniref:Uncharacterized protein n=1 Tax=Cysteiniphilum litorale TaxID=2056700 RepID=A0A8J3E7W1_9GAMM|nr:MULTISPECIES: hypothetical protein [Cysteiniphilum]GGF88866.1 hypothetical protein GCM10010995_02640 [Cysteiniphilum litorale]